MAMTNAEKKRAQRSRERGYALSRECDWRQQGIKNASYQLYLELIISQRSECPICQCAIDNKSPLDHDHQDGSVRSVLCQRCNLMLGHIEAGRQGVSFLRNAATYLESFRSTCDGSTGM